MMTTEVILVLVAGTIIPLIFLIWLAIPTEWFFNNEGDL